MRHTDKEFREILDNFFVDLVENNYYSLFEFNRLRSTAGQDLIVGNILSLFIFIMTTRPSESNNDFMYNPRGEREWVYLYLNQFFSIEGTEVEEEDMSGFLIKKKRHNGN